MKTTTAGFLVIVAAALAALVGCASSDGTSPTTRSKVTAMPAREPTTSAPAQVRAQLAKSVHAKLDCSECHAPGQNGGTGQAHCTGSCHAKETEAYNASIHGAAQRNGKSGAARCDDCHGAHDTRRVSDPESRVAPRNTPRTCGKCHANPEVAEKLGIKQPKLAPHYFESVHGRALLTQGLVVAPSCADCHGKAHAIYEAKDPRSTVNRFNVAKTCGHCHTGPRDRYFAGIHGKALVTEEARPAGAAKAAAKDAKKDAPTCNTCHSAHSILMKGPEFQLESDRICGSCHEDRLARYRDTYHGRASDLGDAKVAACHDCHGEHDILPSTNPASMLSSKNRLNTCRKCHQNAPANFAGYLAHADHSDKVHYPKLYWAFVGMTALLLGTFGFFGIHTIFWLIRSLIERHRNPEAFREEKQRARQMEGARLYTRFRPVDRFVHALVIFSFILLVMTGMPLKFHSTPWAHSIFNAIGGATVAAAVHRFAAIITFGYFALHIASLVVVLRRHRDQYTNDKGRLSTRRLLKVAFGPDSPFPRWQDVKDIWQHMKWFVGLGAKPKFDRFTYWEKFDYMAVFWGVTMIGISGLVMWFPKAFTHFLPGWGINIAHIIHSDEALLAAGFIFTFHFFNSHFRPEKFPYDPVMFSGKVTEEELKHERPAQYERMEKAGELDDATLTAGDWKQWRLIVNPFGWTAIVLGLTLAAAIFYALLT